jgi:hypothetical protein
MLSDRRSAINTLHAAIEAAADKFMMAVSGYGIPEESLLAASELAD